MSSFNNTHNSERRLASNSKFKAPLPKKRGLHFFNEGPKYSRQNVATKE
jgi:hypothetical protein